MCQLRSDREWVRNIDDAEEDTLLELPFFFAPLFALEQKEAR